MRKQKGITLIALVITIIVLIILAAIVINLILGDGGVIQNGIKSRFLTHFSQVKEAVELYKGDSQIDQYIPNAAQRSELPVTTELTTEEKNQIDTLKQTVERITGKVIDTVELYWIDLELIDLKMSHHYIIDVDTHQIYDYEGETFFGQTHHTVEEEQQNIILEDPTPEDISDNKIYTIEDLVRFSQAVNGTNGEAHNYSGETVEIMNNLDFQKEESYKDPQRTDFGDVNGDGTTEALIVELNKAKGFTPIGVRSTPFSGILEGNGKTITNLLVQEGQQSLGGLFGATSNAQIQNLNMKNISISNTAYSGGIVAYGVQELAIVNCSVTGNIESTGGMAGGLVGYVDTMNNIQRCKSNVTITGTAYFKGGILGYVNTKLQRIADTTNQGNISGNGNYSGGIVGNVYCSQVIEEIVNTHNTGNVKDATSGNGGILGWLNGGVETINNCSNEGTIEGYGAAGLIFSMTANIGTMSNCHNSGNVTSTGGIGDAAGLIANVGKITTITNSYNTGDIKAVNKVGGLIATAHYHASSKETIQEMSQCYNTGRIEGNKDNIGGLIGFSYNIITINKCYNTGEIINNTTDNTTSTGGLVGRTDVKILQNSYNMGHVTTSNGYAGGIIGCKQSTSTNSLLQMNDCYNLGDITATRSAGGIIGGAYASTGIKATIQNCNNEGNVQSSNEYAGGIIAEDQMNIEKIEKCTNKGNITGKYTVSGILAEITNVVSYVDNCSNQGMLKTTSSASYGMGGILGNIKIDQDVVITNCNNQAKIDGGSSPYTAGIVGGISLPYNTRTVQISNCYNTAEITGTGGDVAGIVGFSSTSTQITNCSNSGIINGSSIAAGIAGELKQQYNLQNVNNTGNVTGGRYVAGFIADFRGGSNVATIANCFNNAIIKSTETSKYACGGFVGYSAHSGGTQITNSYNNGEIMSNDDTGGIIGYNQGSVAIEKCYNSANIKLDGSNNSTSFGGIIGYNSGGILNLNNIYNVGNIAEDATVTNAGGIFGYGVGTITITNCYTTANIGTATNKGNLFGTAGATINIDNTYYSNEGNTVGTNAFPATTVTDNSSFKSLANMQSDEFVTILNNGGSVWTRKTNKNNGLPIFN